MLYLLPFPVDTVVGVGGVEMCCRCRHVSTEVVLAVLWVLLRRFPIPVVVLPDTGLVVAVGIGSWGLRGSFQAWLVGL